jgi:hypothetical protein
MNKEIKELQKKAREEFDRKFVEKDVPFGGDGNAWPGEDCDEIYFVLVEDITPAEIKSFQDNLIEETYKQAHQEARERVIRDAKKFLRDSLEDLIEELKDYF